MADYIDKNILLQAYVHIQIPASTTTRRLGEIRTELATFAEARGRFFIYPEIDVEIEFKEGSLKSYLTIAGALYMAIANYGSFRSGVDYLYTDIKRLSDTLVAESLFVTRAKHREVIRTEARVGIIGSLKHLVDELNSLELMIGTRPVDEVASRIDRVREDAEKLLKNVRAAEDAELVEQELASTAIKLPSKCPYPKDKKPKEQAIVYYQEALRRFRKRFTRQRKPRG